MHVEINDLFSEKTRDIVINQQNTDNKDNSVNGIIVLLTDKDSVTQLVETIKSRFGNNEQK
ncbi:MAG: hypothetical protein LBC68_12175 [Prevotellaceae bacterium]|nr:hypothetical protein [Prevotellaceae bacterium]